MTYLVTAPEALATATTEVARIGSAISAANATAAGVTTEMLAAAGDQVSSATAALLSSYAREYHSLIKQVTAFHDEFTRALATAGSAYAQTEATNATSAIASKVALIMGGTTIPNPFAAYMTAVQNLFIEPHYPGYVSDAVYTPEEFWPLYGKLQLGQSISQGVALLNTAITGNISSTTSVLVYGYSQSATIATNEIRALMALGSPYTSQLALVLTGDPNNPDGGVFERFTGLYIPILDVAFNGATPPNSPYPTTIYTAQYDAVADFPQYPLHFLSDVNAIMGTFTGAHDYSGFTSTQVAGAVALPTSPNYTGDTQYYMVLNQNLPLLDPIRQIPYVGSTIADLIQPDLRVLVDMGYGDIGYGHDYANVATPAQLFSPANPVTVLPDLARGAVQGAQAALADVGALPQSSLPDIYPYVPSLDPGLHLYLGQSSVTGLSLLTNALGSVADGLGLIPSWD